jgi:hypothetical protein
MSKSSIFQSSESQIVCVLEKTQLPSTKKRSHFEETSTVSEESTKMLLSRIQPRLIVVMSGHTHHYCLRLHSGGPTNIPIPEYSVPSFSWRNREDPSFFLVSFQHTQYTTKTFNNYSIHILIFRDYLRKMDIDYPNAIYVKKAR